jgi:hypothetical protein
VQVVKDFEAAMKEQGGRCEAHFYPGVGHGFFNQEPYTSRTLGEADRFLESLGWVKRESTTQEGKNEKRKTENEKCKMVEADIIAVREQRLPGD